MAITIFKRSTREEKFWKWVIRHKNELEDFIRSDFKDYGIYNQLSAKAREYHPMLYPEMTIGENGETVLILSADGQKEGLRPVEVIFEAKPVIDNWIVHKFRQAKDEISLNFEDTEFPSSHILVIPEIDSTHQKVNAAVYIKNLNSNLIGSQALFFLYLDHILGEYNVISFVGTLEFLDWNIDQTPEEGISLLELRYLIEKDLISGI
ncbi:hypothetical protein [Croceimicrobium hydrocarbonivorans]|uniref:DUF695 domain-containing protein n=1 Tax=Croceimicrobium hydrocarbonivorans TaxID=2761580 RepID=A0A7H0VFV7_9FLAO|nr:hypothetical protein [Croceimicrobium hydrocarbonivorans]QNR24605.1 hypothetical protein H4K34_01820 [Croceimicrobium hydrocarbonivorans]